MYRRRTWPDLEKTGRLPGAAVTNYQKLGDENNRDVFSLSSGGQKSETQVSAELVLSGGSGISSGPFSKLLVVAANPWCSLACPRVTPVSASFIQAFFPVCVSVCVSVQIFLSLKAHYSLD